MARKRKKSISDRLNLKQLSLFLLLVIASVLAVYYFFRITQIEAIVDGEPYEKLANQLSSLKGRSLFFTNYEQTPIFTSTLKNEQGQIFEPQRLEKELPNKLIVYFSLQDPLYRLSWDQELYLVNSRHFLAEDSPEFDLPVVELSDEYADQIKGDKINSNLNHIIQNLIANLKQVQIQPSKIYLDKSDSFIIFKGTKFVFEDGFDKSVLAAKIKIIEVNLDNLKNISGGINFIDMRFDLPVLHSSNPNLNLSEQELEIINSNLTQTQEDDGEPAVEDSENDTADEEAESLNQELELQDEETAATGSPQALE